MMTAEPLASVAPPPSFLPPSFWQAARRGVLSKCPRCGRAPLFRKWLKSVDTCAACDQDWTHQRADDFPAYIAIIVTGHVLAPVMIMLSLDWELGPLASLAFIMPVSIAMMLGILQPSKGAVIALQWWQGMHGFRKERLPLSQGARPE